MKSSSLSLLPLVGFVALAVAVVGCATGSVVAEDDTLPDDIVDADGGTTPDGAPKPPTTCEPGKCPAGFYNLDGKGDGANCGCEYACTKKSEEDAFDIAFIDANCDGSDGMVNECVYVSTSIGNDTGDGTRQKPFKTIARAVVVAGAGTKKRPVCLSAEKYTEPVELPSGVSLYGGFNQADPTFPFRRSFKNGTQDIATTIVAPTTGPTAGTGILIQEIKEEMHVENLTIDVKIGEAQNGQSVYGVRVGGGTGQLFLRKNVLLLGNANPGAGGANGVPPSTSPAPNGNVGGNGCSNCSSFGQGGAAPVCSSPGGRGGNGSNGSGNDGAPGSPGAGGASGGGGGGGTSCISSGNGGPGGPGNPGAAGSVPAQGGVGAASLGTVVTGLYVAAKGAAGPAGGNGGGGGGGGGGGSSARSWPICYDDGAGGGGSGGCGGAGGPGGGGGDGGGSVIGLLLGGATAVVEANVFTLGNGGAGGKGGTGATGQPGGTGMGGGSPGPVAGTGGRGGNGGGGGSGAGGGGGAGGHSVRIARAPTAVVTEATNTGTLGTAGPGGDGGSGGTGAPAGTKGTAGLAKELLVVGN
jgi:hypothetical protein